MSDHYNSAKEEGKNVLNNYCADKLNKWSIMLPAIPNLSKHIDRMERNKEEMSNIEQEEQKSQQDYEAEVKLFRALENLQKNCLVLHSWKKIHYMIEAIHPGHDCSSSKCKKEKPHRCDRDYSDVEGETDFLVIGKNYFATFEVKNPVRKKFICRLNEGIDQTESTEEILNRLMKLELRSSEPKPMIFKFCVFPFLDKEEVNSRLEDRPQSATKLLFKADLENFKEWWDEHIENQHDQHFIPSMSEDLKAIIVGFDRKKYNFAESIREIDKSLRESKITREKRGKYKNGEKKGGENGELTATIINTEIQPSTGEMKELGIKYLRKSQQAAFENKKDHLLINGPAGTGKTIILQALLLQIARKVDESSEEVAVVFAFGHKAAEVYKKILTKSDIKFCFKKINNINSKSHQNIEKAMKQSTDKVTILCVNIVDFSKSMLEILIEIIKRLKERGALILIDDIQCLLTPNSLPKFEIFIKCISTCKYVRMTFDAVQLFYYSKAKDEIEALNQTLKRIGNHMTVIKLESNIRNSYEIASLLESVREQFTEIKPNIIMVPPQTFAHYIHGLKAVIHVIYSKRMPTVYEQINILLEKEKNKFCQENDDSFQILWMKGSKVARHKNIRSHGFKLDASSKIYCDKIRNCYSREWLAVVGLIAITKNTDYREFLSWVYLAVSRARVYSSLILYVENGRPPDFLAKFLESVQSSCTLTTTIIKNDEYTLSTSEDMNSTGAGIKRIRLEDGSWSDQSSSTTIVEKNHEYRPSTSEDINSARAGIKRMRIRSLREEIMETD